MKRAALLCLLLAACDRAGEDASARKTGSSAAVAEVRGSGRPTSPWQSTAAYHLEQVAASLADPEVQRLLVEIQALESIEPFLDNPCSELAKYLAEHYPEAGLAWIRHLEGDLAAWGIGWFADSLCRTDLPLAWRLFDRLTTDSQRHGFYCSLYSREMRGESVGKEVIERLWTAADRYSIPLREEEVRGLIGSESRLDPVAAWQRMEDHRLENMSLTDYLRNTMYLGGETPYPVALLERVPEEEFQGAVEGAFMRCTTPESLAPLIQWLEERPPSTADEPFYESAAFWYAKYLDYPTAARWINRAGPEVRGKFVSYHDREQGVDFTELVDPPPLRFSAPMTPAGPR